MFWIALACRYGVGPRETSFDRAKNPTSRATPESPRASKQKREDWHVSRFVNQVYS